MISQLTLKVQARGVAAASKEVQSLATGVGALQQAIDALAKSGPAIKTVAADLKLAASAANKIGSSAAGIMALTQAMQSFTSVASQAAAATGQIAIKDYTAALRNMQAANAAANQAPAQAPSPAPISNIRTALEGMSPAFAAVSQGFSTIGAGIKSAEAFMQPLTGAVQAGIGAFQQLKAAIDGATSALLQMGQEGAQVSQMGVAFEAIGGSAKRMQELRDLTGGIVDDMALQKSFNMATLFDIPKDAVPKLLKAAQGASIAMGITAEKAVNDVMVAVARKSKPIADNIGVQMGNLKEVYQKFATSAGKDVKQLTEEEKQLAFTNVFLEKATRQMSLASAAQGNVFAQLTAQTTNMENEMKVLVSEMLAGSGALDFVTSGMKQMREAMDGSTKGVLMGAMKTLFMTGMELGKMLVPVFTAAIPVITTALDLFNIFAPIITGTLQVVGKLTQGLILAVRVALVPFVKALDLVVWTIQELADTVGITTPSLDGMREGIDQFMSNTGAMLEAGFDPKMEVKPEPVITKTDAEKFVETASEKMQEQLRNLDRTAAVTLQFTTGGQQEGDSTGLANALAIPPEHLAAMREMAAEQIRRELGGGIMSGFIGAAGDSAAQSAAIFGALGADISGASEASLKAAGKAMIDSTRAGMMAAGKGGEGPITLDDVFKFGDVAKIEAAGGIKLFTKELGSGRMAATNFNSGISDMHKALTEAFNEQEKSKLDDHFKGMFDSVKKFGLIKQDAPFQLMSQNDIAALLEYQESVRALSDDGEILTGSQALMTNAIRAAGGQASGAVTSLEEYRKMLEGAGTALVMFRSAAEMAGLSTDDFNAKLRQQADQLKVIDAAIKGAKEEEKKQKKGGGKKNDGKQSLRERAEMVGLGDFEKARLQAERTLAKDMKTAGADASLKEAARTIYADAVGKPALDELARIGNALGGATTRIGGMLASSAKALFDNPEVSDMVRAAKENLARAGLGMQTVDLGNGQSRRLTEREVAVNMELIALEKEWAAKRAILQEGSNAYLLVQSDYLLKKKALDDELKTQQEESAFAMLAGFEGVFSRVQGTFESLRDQGTVGEQAVAMLSGTVLSLGQDMAGMAEQFKGIDEAVKKGSLTSGQAEVQKANAVVGAAGRAAAGVIKNERARAAVQGAVEVALAASSYAIGDIASGIAHTAAAGLFFAAAGRGSGGAAAARNITPRRSAAGSDRSSTAGDRRQAQTQVNIFIDPLNGRGIVDTVNRDAGRQAGLAFNSRVMQGAARRTDL